MLKDLQGDLHLGLDLFSTLPYPEFWSEINEKVHILKSYV